MTEKIPNKDSTILKYFVLPLVGITFNKLGEGFNRVYVNKEGTLVFLEFSTIPKKSYSDNFYSTMPHEDLVYQIYSVPTEFIPAMQAIIAGKYSRMDLGAKKRIIKFSGLIFRKKNPRTGKIVSSVPLLALDRNAELRYYLEDKFGHKYKKGGRMERVEISPTSELLDIPTEDIFIEKIL